ncbi:MAG: pyridoxamine 5'-phosphate oxidase family protein [Methanimicrococcus sp.]|nr:pyridoxamine 5'-phosphate oxidase family protein [Methanimicrococcus sp.]
MQNRMKNHPLAEEEIDSLLETELIGHLATVQGNQPYVVPVHFFYQDQKIYIHGLHKGQKLKNISENQNVCFEVSRFEKLIMPTDNSPCDVNTQYRSVIIKGTAKIVEEDKAKTGVLNQIVEKYTPILSGIEFGDSIKETAVIEITIKEMTGKYYP